MSVPVKIFLAVLLSFPALLVAQTPAGRLSPLATEPDWGTLRQYQGTISHDHFARLLDTVFAPGGAAKSVIEVSASGANILASGSDRYFLQFAPEGREVTPPRYWRPIDTMPGSHMPLRGITIALDPGHLGGAWAKMEERWFSLRPGTIPVAEGDMTLLTAQLLAMRLRAQGATVEMVRDSTEPLTKLRPEMLLVPAHAQLERQHLVKIRESYNGPNDALKMNSAKWVSELLFYRTAEILARAALVNTTLKPDLVLCLHYNAEEWGDETKPRLVPHNHMHLLVNGGYSAPELELDDVRYSMLVKLLGDCNREEMPVAEHIAKAMAEATGLPPYKYTTTNAKRVGDNPYVWARNLLANRLYQCPVVYIEPYVMNCQEVWDRVQAGDYEGRKLVDGKQRESIYREYANAVAVGAEAAARDLRR